MAGEIPPAQPPPGVGAPRPARQRPSLLWPWRRNPLRRRTDRVRAWLAVGLVLGVPAAAPVAMFTVGDAAHRHYRGVAADEAASRDQHPAVLVRDVPRHPEPGSDEARRTRYPVEVRFTGPDGVPRTGRTDVEPGSTAGSRVLVRVDPSGGITGPPLSTDQIRSRTMDWAILAFLGVVLAGLAAHGAAGLVLWRRDLAAWDAAWAATAPRWSGPP
ncbi:Rv1733c family protein [Streptomyces parvulus]|uniref:Rv1733c family protein n=1 Tax=Streptomyces parvulus TaxID=146923 RepID=UPI003822C232